MKKRIFSAIAAILLIASAVSMAACGGDTYSQLANKGYTLKVSYDVSGADVGGKQITNIVEIYSSDNAVEVDGKKGFYLLPLDDDKRGSDVLYELEKYDEDATQFFLVGWYKQRENRVDENGNALDYYGRPTSETKREQGYTFSGLWNFDEDLLSVDDFDENGDFNLYAAWAPRFTYEFYTVSGEGELQLIKTLESKLVLNYPVYRESRGSFDMKDYPTIDGMTFEGAYFDEAMTSPITGNIDGRDILVDYEKGIITSNVIRIYVTYSETASE